MTKQKQNRRTRLKQSKQTSQSQRKTLDDFISVARRFGADEDKATFEAKLAKIAKAKVTTPIKGSRAR
jgi:hypothetical protein